MRGRKKLSLASKIFVIVGMPLSLIALMLVMLHMYDVGNWRLQRRVELHGGQANRSSEKRIWTWMPETR